MTDPKEVDLWFSMGSTYTYLTIMRLPQMQQLYDVQIHLRPFNLGKIFKESNYFPFLNDPAKQAHMWRDIERKAATYGFSAKTPVPWPAPDALLANKVCYVANREGWGLELARECYIRWFDHGDVMGGEENLARAIDVLGKNTSEILQLAASNEIGNAIDAETELARKSGIFGSPSFVVGDEMFWGNDRLEDALNWSPSLAV
jgi:2-hydroxychromene-2-carboxylate isomerase